MKDLELRAGCAIADITPGPGIHLGGFWGRTAGAVNVHDALNAKVLVFASGECRAALVALDLVGLEAPVVQRLRHRIQEEVGIPGEGVMVCSSHTHSGPLTVGFRGMGEVDPDYLEKVQEAVVGATARALSSWRPACLAYQKVPVQLGLNRRQQRDGNTVIGQDPGGVVVPYAHVVRIDAGEDLLATLFSHPCHPVVLGHSNHSVSGDFPGAAARYIEAKTHRPALFVNGACGDINPRSTGGDFAAVADLGRELGQAVVGGLGPALTLDGEGGIRCRVEKVRLPLVDPPPRVRMQAEKLVLQLKAEVKKIARGGGDTWAQRVPRARLAWARDMLERASAGGEGRHQPFEIQGLRIGALLLLGLEGEIFAGYQLELEKRSLLQPTILCGYANGCTGYVPTADEYARGGYEVEEAYKVYPTVQMIAPESEELIQRRAEAIIAGLSGP